MVLVQIQQYKSEIKKQGSGLKERAQMRQACVRKDAPGSRMLTKAVFICSLAAVQSTFVNWTDAAMDGELS